MKRFIKGLFFVMPTALLVLGAVSGSFDFNGKMSFSFLDSAYASTIFGNTDESYIIHKVDPQLVRVGISDNSFSNYLFDKVQITSHSGFIVTDNNSGEIKFEPNTIADIKFLNGEFEVKNGDDIVFKSKNKLHFLPTNKNLAIVGLMRKSKQALYSGEIELEISKTKPDKFAIVNILPIQTYLKGVVPNEMPVNFGLEALKAQAVLARNYVLKPREKYYKEFDICDSVACQVYFGANTQESLSDKAVDETQNIVVLYDKELILAVYSSTAGGHTESYKNVFMQNMQGRIMSPHVPYLIGVPDTENVKEFAKGGEIDTEEETVDFYTATPETFDNNSPYFRWKREWSMEELQNTLSKTLPTVKNTGFLKTKYPADFSKPDFLGNIKSIYINKRGVSGKVVALTVITNKNEFTLYKELIIRKVFQHNNKLLPSANVFFKIKQTQDCDTKNKNCPMTVIVQGGGLGHGVGMSQWGAGMMAKKGHKFEDIIHHYYTNVNIAVLPVLVNPEKPVTIEFYLDKKKAVLNVENNVQNSDLNIIINERYVDSSYLKKLTKEKKVDISHYLRRGKNIITYEIKNNKHAKSLKFWIETEE